MASLINSQNECDALRQLLLSIMEDGKREGNYLELQTVLLSIPFQEKAWEKYKDIREDFLDVIGDVGLVGWDRATRVFTTLEDKRSKPSYLNRLVSYPDKPRKKNYSKNQINQLDSIVNDFLKKPGYSCLSFVVLRPADLIDKFRPGYVPCVIAGDFKFRGGLLNLNVMFRTSDALTVGFADIYHLRTIQQTVLDQAKDVSDNDRILNGSLGNLNMFFSRTYVSRSIKRKSGGAVNGFERAQKAINFLETC